MAVSQTICETDFCKEVVADMLMMISDTYLFIRSDEYLQKTLAELVSYLRPDTDDFVVDGQKVVYFGHVE